MGDRGNIYVKDYNEGEGTYLYSHWGGTELPQVVQSALAKRARWDDNPYLTRIIFCEMIKDAYDEETGYGISATVGDGNDRVLVLDPNSQTLWREGNEESAIPFDEFVAIDNPTWDSI